MMTAAIRTEIHVLRLLMMVHGRPEGLHYRPNSPPTACTYPSRRRRMAAGSRNLLQQATGFFRRERVVVAVGQRNRGAQFGVCRGLVPRFQGQLAELEMAACVDPFSPVERQRFPEI